MIISHQPILITAAQKDVLNAAANIAKQPSGWIQIGEQFFQIGDAFFPLVQTDFQFSSFDIERDFAIVVFDQRHQFLVAWQSEFVFAFLYHRDRDLFLNTCIIWEQLFQAIPYLERFLSPLGSLMHTTELPKNLQHVGATWFAFDGTLKRCDRFLRLTDQQQTLPHVIAGHRVFG